MPISGVVIRCLPERSGEVFSFIAPRRELELQWEDGETLIAVIETASVAEEVDLLRDLLAVEGVLDVGVAYHNFEDMEEQPLYA